AATGRMSPALRPPRSWSRCPSSRSTSSRSDTSSEGCWRARSRAEPAARPSSSRLAARLERMRWCVGAEGAGDCARGRDGIALAVDADRDVTGAVREHDLVEAAVADDHVAEAAAVELAPLASEREQRRVDEQLLVEVGRASGRVREAGTLGSVD